MVPDPYKALNLPHSATQNQIKRSYRELARRYHPDRLVRQQCDRVVTDWERDRATAKFAETAAAYSLLSDPKRKADYDHVYKFGGFDDDEDAKLTNGDSCRGRKSTFSTTSETIQREQQHNPQQRQDQRQARKRRKSNGIGYACSDPLAFLWTQGKIQSTRTVAGVQIPSRLQMAQPSSGLSFAFSTGQYATSHSGTRKYISRTTQFAQGKKFTRVQTTTIHPDGRKEVVIEGDDYVERRYSTTTRGSKPTKANPEQNVDDNKKNGEHQQPGEFPLHEENVAAQQSQEDPLPWYMNAWHGIKDKLTMCHNPCAVAV